MSTTTTTANEGVYFNSTHLLKNELTDFQSVLAVDAFQSITNNVSATKIREKMCRIVFLNKNLRIPSQIKVLLKGTDPRYNFFYQSAPTGGPLTVDPLYNPNRGTEEI